MSMRTTSLPERRRSRRSLACLMLALALTLTASLSGQFASADTVEELERQQRSNELRQEELASALEGTSAELAQIYLDLNQLELELPIAQAALDQAVRDLAAAERHLQSVRDRLAVAEAQRDQLVAEIEQAASDIAETASAIGELARSTYRGGMDISALSVVLDAADPQDFANRYSAVGTAVRSQTQVLDDLQTLAAVQRNQQARLDAVRVRIGELEVEATEAVAAAETARQIAADRTAEIQRMQREREVKASELEERRDDFVSQQAALESDNAQLRDQIQAIYREQEAERRRQEEERRRQEETASRGGGGSATGGGTGGGGTGGGGGSSGLALAPPVAAPFYVTSPYGYRIYPITGGRYMHYGTDIRSACGNAQYVAASGTVIAVRGAVGNGTHGNQVMIDHGVVDGRSVVTVYNHLSRFNVSYGQSVSQGQVLGYTGMTGAVTGCHVHVEVWVNGSTVDPESLAGWNRSN